MLQPASLLAVLRNTVVSRRFVLAGLRVMDVITLNAWSDNYMYLVVDKATKICAAVDPVEPDKILQAVKRNDLKLASVLTTHHHADHASGNGKLVKGCKEAFGTDLIVYGGDQRVDAVNRLVSDGEEFKIGGSLSAKCLATPCHTSGHICYHVTDEQQDGAVFTGDTLFLGGCGRFFEGTPEQMHKALLCRLAKLPLSTKVYCGHEYTVKNLEFGLTVEPNNQTLQKRLTKARDTRAQGNPTVPGTIEEELNTNPFMRVDQPDVLAHAKTDDPIKAMKIIREEKDRF